MSPAQPRDPTRTADARAAQSANKRRRVDDEGPAVRRRAATACALCRRRKAKCDNARPQCGFCRAQRAVCQYEDDATEPAPYDPASREILERLDELRGLLTLDGPRYARDRHGYDAGLVSSSDGPACVPTPADGGSPIMAQGVHAHTSAESLLRWKVFRDVLPVATRDTQSFPFGGSALLADSTISGYDSAHSRLETPRAMTGMHRPGIDEDDLVPLCTKFVQLVHPRNPILDVKSLLDSAREAKENGLGWDACSCLLLIACALARLTTPWASAEYFEDSGDQPPSPDIVFDQKSLAEAYYNAARKRIGLLDRSITSIQCLFFASIYEKHAMRPVEAYEYLHQASSRLYVYQLRRHSGRSNAMDDLQEERLASSLFKAESELQPALGLPRLWRSSDDLTHALPAPPTQLFDTERTESPTDDLEERGWYFYLAELSLRRRIEDTSAVMYERPPVLWATHPEVLVARYKECESQVETWHAHLHPCVQFDNSSFPSNELAFYLRGRFYEWRTLLLRPFLCCMANDDRTRYPADFSLLAVEYLSLCGEYIVHMSYHGRHGGTWFMCRSSFACAMSILAGIFSAQEMLLYGDWKSAVQTSLRTLRRWAPEAADVGAMHAVLEATYGEACVRLGHADEA